MSKTVRGLLLVVALLLFVSGIAKGQGLDAPDFTEFVVTCQVQTPDSITIQWGYSSSGGELWFGSGMEFVTEAGDHPFYFQTILDLPNVEIPVISLGHMVEVAPAMEEYQNVIIEFVLDGLPDCDNMPEPTPSPTPTPPVCPAWSYESSLGIMICLWDLPYAP